MNVDSSYFRKYLLMAISVIIANAINAQSRHNMAVNLPKDLELVKKAKSGSADAQAFVGKCYYWGECGVKEYIV